MNLKQTISLAILIGGITLCGESSLVHAIEHEQEWINSWGGNDDDLFKSITSTSDGGVIAVGGSYSTDAGFTNQGVNEAIIVKYDSDGKQQWVKSWGGSDWELFNSVTETQDGGFVVVGKSCSTDAGFTNQGHYDAIIVKYDSMGNQEWMKSWGGNGSDDFSSVIETTDGGLLAIGHSRSTDMGFTWKGMDDVIIVKFDQDGNQQWMKSWGGNGEDWIRSVIETTDGGFLVVGGSNSTNGGFANHGLCDAIMVKFDQDGNQQWIKSWGGNNTEIFNSVVKTTDGGFLAVGHGASTNIGITIQGNFDAIIVKFDQDGNQQWIESWGGSGWDQFNSVIKTNDGGFLAVGRSASTNIGITNQGRVDAIIVKYDSDGNQQWVKSWGGTDNEEFNSVIETSNGELVIAGYSYSTDVGFENQGDRDAIIVKFSPKTDADIQINGNIQALMADVTLPSVSPDLVINPNLSQGSVSPEFEIINDSISPIKLGLRTFEQTTHSFNDVLPDKYDSWEGLNKTQSQDLALGLIAKEGVGWQRLTTPMSYVAGHSEHEIGVIKPTSTVSFEFDVHHGRAFSEAKTVQYRMVFVFDLLN